MFEAKIRSLFDMDLKNEVCFKSLVAGEVTTFIFKNHQELEDLLRVGRFELVGNEVPEQKIIPVVNLGESLDSNLKTTNEEVQDEEVEEDTPQDEVVEESSLSGNLDKLNSEG